jgi:hypothetical protein
VIVELGVVLLDVLFVGLVEFEVLLVLVELLLVGEVLLVELPVEL